MYICKSSVIQDSSPERSLQFTRNRFVWINCLKKGIVGINRQKGPGMILFTSQIECGRKAS
jgi:hypothetical protein